VGRERFGFDDLEWDELVAETIKVLWDVARRERTITYGDLSRELHSRGQPRLDPRYGAMPHLLESVSRLDTVRELFDAFSRKRDILHLLDRCLASDGVQLFIGDESGYSVLDDYSLVTAPYQIKGTVAGVLAVIGPTRMNYARIIPMVDYTARVVSRLLGSPDVEMRT
jgi:heat-inducible transcriptional repressor